MKLTFALILLCAITTGQARPTTENPVESGTSSSQPEESVTVVKRDPPEDKPVPIGLKSGGTTGEPDSNSTACPANQTMKECGKFCDKKCDDQHRYCKYRCGPTECACKEGFYWLGVKCVTLADCPKLSAKSGDAESATSGPCDESGEAESATSAPPAEQSVTVVKREQITGEPVPTPSGKSGQPKSGTSEPSDEAVETVPTEDKRDPELKIGRKSQEPEAGTTALPSAKSGDAESATSGPSEEAVTIVKRDPPPDDKPIPIGKKGGLAPIPQGKKHGKESATTVEPSQESVTVVKAGKEPESQDVIPSSAPQINSSEQPVTEA